MRCINNTAFYLSKIPNSPQNPYFLRRGLRICLGEGIFLEKEERRRKVAAGCQSPGSASRHPRNHFGLGLGSSLPINDAPPPRFLKIVHPRGGRLSLPGQPAGLLHLPLSGLPFPPRLLPGEGAKETHDGAQQRLKTQNQLEAAPSSRTCGSCPSVTR